MLKLGTTYNDVLQAACFGPEESECLSKYFIECFNAALEPDEVSNNIGELMSASTDTGPFETGKFLLVEDEDDLVEMIAETNCGNLLLTPSKDDYALDLAMYLNKKETTAILMQCTSNSGGDIYVITQEIFEEYPSIHEHIFKANQE